MQEDPTVLLNQQIGLLSIVSDFMTVATGLIEHGTEMQGLQASQLIQSMGDNSLSLLHYIKSALTTPAS